MQAVKMVRGAILAAGAMTATLAAGAATAEAWSPPAPIASSVAKTTNVPVTMSDGTVLYVDVVRPADSSGHALRGRYPVLLTQTPYNKNGALSFEDDYLVEHGYVQVIAERGLKVVSDTAALAQAADDAIAANPDIAAKVRGGKVAAVGALVGAVMKATRGQADAAAVRAILLERLGVTAE